MANDRYEAGMEVRRKVLGADHVARTAATTSDFDRDFQQWITETAWGGVWTRDHLDQRTKSLLTIAILAALGREELDLHLRATPNTGVTLEDLAEVFFHVAVYAGVPVANRGFARARELLAVSGDQP